MSEVEANTPVSQERKPTMKILALVSVITLAGVCMIGYMEGKKGTTEEVTATETKPPVFNQPPMLKKMLEDGNVTLEGSFPAGDGLRGWVISDGVQKNILYSSPSNAFLIAGAIIGPNGENLTASHHNEWVQPDTTATSKLNWDSLEDRAWFETGSGDTTVYAVYEPFCGECSKLVGLISQVELKVRWVPVAFLAHESVPAGASLLDSKSPQKDLLEWTAARTNGMTAQFLESKGAPTPENLQAIESNMAVMREFNLQGTPALIAKDSNGNVQVFSGTPPLQVLETIAAKG